jgi:putative ABC transport system permease protein
MEYSVTGALAGLLAAIGASAGSWAIARFALDIEWQFSLLLLGAGLVAGAACAMAGAWRGLHKVLAAPPLQSLRAQ